MVVGVIAFVSLPVYSQEPHAAKFEVASVKLGDRDSRQVGIHSDNIPNPNAVSIFTALQEQLGLRLESGKGLVQVLFIDHAEKPDAN